MVAPWAAPWKSPISDASSGPPTRIAGGQCPGGCRADRWAGSGSVSSDSRPLLPALHHHPGLGVEAHRVLAGRVQVAEEGALPTGEGEEGHRRGDADVDADHARLDPRAEVPGVAAAAGEDAGRVAVLRAVDDLDRRLDGGHADHRQHRPEDLLARRRRVRVDAVEDRRRDEEAVLGDPVAAVDEPTGTVPQAALHA